MFVFYRGGGGGGGGGGGVSRRLQVFGGGGAKGVFGNVGGGVGKEGEGHRWKPQHLVILFALFCLKKKKQS